MEDIENLIIIILGSSKVGKTSIIHRYFKNEYNEENISTIGIDHNNRFYKFWESKIRIDYIDTAGQEVFRAIAANYLKKADGVILVFDITQRDTFELVDRWIEELEKNNNINNIGKILLGNKIDLEDERKIKDEEGHNLAKTINCNYMEVSAKTGENVKEALDEVAKLTYEKYISSPRAKANNSFSIKREEKKVKFNVKKKGSKATKCCQDI